MPCPNLRSRVATRGTFTSALLRPSQCQTEMPILAETQRRLARMGLSLERPMSVVDLYRWFDPAHWRSPDPDVRRVSAKLSFGLPTVAFHMALLSRDQALVDRIRPHVEDMVQVMLDHGRDYRRGENFNRAVVLGLQLSADWKQELP